MVVLSASVCTKDGQVLVARQFVPIPRLRLESLLASFPKLRSGDSQHTFVESDNVRFVYQPLDELYVILITNLQSNIIRDLATLRLFAKIIPDFVESTRPEHVREAAFDLVFAFDELVTAHGGYGEKVTPQQVHTFLEMDSHDEKLQLMLLESKMSSARNEARRRAEELEREKQEKRKLQSLQGYSGYPGNARMDAYNSGYSPRSAPPAATPSPTVYGGSSPSASAGIYSGSTATTSSVTSEKGSPYGKTASSATRKKGMTLGRSKRKSDDFVQAIAKEEQVSEAVVAAAAALDLQTASASAGGSLSEGMDLAAGGPQVYVRERVDARLERDGEVIRFDVKGTLSLNLFDPDHQRLVIHTSGLDPRDKSFRIQLFPKLDSRLFRNHGHLRLERNTETFPLGRDNSINLLQWRFSSQDETQLPFSLNFWPNVEHGRTVCTLKFQQEREGLTLEDVQIFVPLSNGSGGRMDPPEITQLESGTEWTFDSQRCLLGWRIGTIDDDRNSGTLEFSVPERDEESFWPIQAIFHSQHTYCPVQVEGVRVVKESGEVVESEEVDFELTRELTVETYQWE